MISKFLSSIKKTVNVFNNDLLFNKIKNNDPELITVARFNADPASNPKKVYRNNINRGPIF